MPSRTVRISMMEQLENLKEFCMLADVSDTMVLVIIKESAALHVLLATPSWVAPKLDKTHHTALDTSAIVFLNN